MVMYEFIVSVKTNYKCFYTYHNTAFVTIMYSSHTWSVKPK